MKCKYCNEEIKVEVKLISFLNNEMFVECPHCLEMTSENDEPEDLEIIRLTYDETEFL